jgi:hypothetical protein
MCETRQVDALRKNDIERARCTSEAKKLSLALDLMATGIQLKRAALTNRYPNETEEQIEKRLRRWLIETER